MKQQFLTYQQFDDYALAMNTAEILEKNQINYVVEEDRFSFDPSFVMNNPQSKKYNLKIASGDFIKAKEVLEKEEEVHIDEVDQDYYLYAFTDDELTEVVLKADEWSAFDFVLAKKILNQRGIIISEPELALINQKRLKDLSSPEKSDQTWIIVGYISAAAGGILGFFIGWFLSTYKQTLPNGERVYGYDEGDRKHGSNIFKLSFIGLAVWLWVLFARQ